MNRTLKRKPHSLAGGFFTGKYTPINGPSPSGPAESGSLSMKTNVGKTYRKKYFNDAYFQALEMIEPVMKAHDLTLVEVGLRWLVHHSRLKILDGNDGVIIG